MKPMPGTHAGTWRTVRALAGVRQHAQSRTCREEVDEGRDRGAEFDSAADGALGEDDELVVEGGDAVAVRDLHHHCADIPSVRSSAR